MQSLDFINFIIIKSLHVWNSYFAPYLLIFILNLDFSGINQHDDDVKDVRRYWVDNGLLLHLMEINLFRLFFFYC